MDLQNGDTDTEFGQEPLNQVDHIADLCGIGIGAHRGEQAIGSSPRGLGKAVTTVMARRSG
ncbi:MAG: hypothetical protein RIC87_00685 [Kiloniellales bacterium]